MTHKSRTPDERFLICLFETAEALGGSHHPLNRYDVGQKVGIQPKGVNAICNLLIRANFIKKVGEIEIYLTDHGQSLVEQLLSER